MTTLEQYLFLILPRQQNPLPEDEYGEVHHVIPTSLGGPDVAWNKVKLPPEEHFRAHQLLVDLYTDAESKGKMAAAAWLMAHTREGLDITEEEYGKLKRNFSAKMKGHPGWNKGNKYSAETRKRMSEIQKRRQKRNPPSEETRRKISQSKKGYHHSLEAKRRMSEAHKGKPWTKARRRAALKW